MKIFSKTMVVCLFLIVLLVCSANVLLAESTFNELIYQDTFTGSGGTYTQKWYSVGKVEFVYGDQTVGQFLITKRIVKDKWGSYDKQFDLVEIDANGKFEPENLWFCPQERTLPKLSPIEDGKFCPKKLSMKIEKISSLGVKTIVTRWREIKAVKRDERWGELETHLVGFEKEFTLTLSCKKASDGSLNYTFQPIFVDREYVLTLSFFENKDGKIRKVFLKENGKVEFKFNIFGPADTENPYDGVTF